MGLNETASADRLHIGFFGVRNAGKSSLVNAVTGQELSIVSDIKGTTTDIVKKAMELLPLGPVVIIDTAGIDDEGELGQLRIKSTKRVLNYADIAVLVVDATKGIQETDKALIESFKAKSIDYIIAYNKADLLSSIPPCSENEIYVSAKDSDNINELKELIGKLSKKNENNKRIVSDLINPNDFVVLVVPIDKAAPKGRLILPQQQTIRDILDSGAISIVARDSELSETLNSLRKKPSLVITDSQAFGKVNRLVPNDIKLTSFSILFARYKGDLAETVKGAAMLDRLSDGDKVLISEGCTHHRQCGDIGTEKLPEWIREYTGKNIDFSFTSGMDFPENISEYSLVIHCGGCMLNEREMKSRLRSCIDANIPITNYGIAIAHINGILKRSLGVFPDMLGNFE